MQMGIQLQAALHQRDDAAAAAEERDAAEGGFHGDALPARMADAGIPLAHVLRMASENPARRIGSANKGRIETGADADIVLMDEKLNIKAVMSGGRMIRDETDPGLSEG